ncbi:odorant receptor 129-1 [Engraulis encrasicolus]|uniref:odorant receptor 129-1 n=1 Tax=Engraulis encrasicolus TaxID=184585 RepID=UPI002FD213D9
MQNLTDISFNSSSNNNSSGIGGVITASDQKVAVIVKVCVVLPVFGVFLYFIVLMLHTFASHRHFLESTRYVLFTYMLANDTLQLLTSVLLFLLVMAQVNFALVFCAPLLFFSTATFLNTPLILAVMSLERYVAIFYPLQRPAAWRPDRIWLLVLAIWLLSCVQPAADFVVSLMKPPSVGDGPVDLLTTPVQCKSAELHRVPTLTFFKVVLNGLFFVAVAVVILFTYVRILLGTRSIMRQERGSVTKALHTVLLHGLQLLLSSCAFTIPFTEHLIVLHVGWSREHMSFLNYVSFVVVPRVLSPVIYGLRDESLRKHMRRSPLCCGAVTGSGGVGGGGGGGGGGVGGRGLGSAKVRPKLKGKTMGRSHLLP